jgi:hypothetical protein
MTKILIRVVGQYLIREYNIKDGLFLFLKELSSFKQEYSDIENLENIVCTLKKHFISKAYPNFLEDFGFDVVVLKLNIHNHIKNPLFDEIHLQINDFSHVDLILTQGCYYEIRHFNIDNRANDKLSVIDTINKINNFTTLLGIKYE